MLDVLQEVLDRAHRGHEYIRDNDQYHRPEFWEIGLVGDCEDFALWCRQELAAVDIPSDLIHCRTERGEGHLVCSVDGYVLDNRSKWVRRRDDIDYTWISVGKPDGTWFKIAG